MTPPNEKRRRRRRGGRGRRQRERSRQYPRIKVHVEVWDKDDEIILEYSFWLNDNTSRNAFAARCADAWKAGQAVLTYLDTENDNRGTNEEE